MQSPVCVCVSISSPCSAIERLCSNIDSSCSCRQWQYSPGILFVSSWFRFYGVIVAAYICTGDNISAGVSISHLRIHLFHSCVYVCFHLPVSSELVFIDYFFHFGVYFRAIKEFFCSVCFYSVRSLFIYSVCTRSTRTDTLNPGPNGLGSDQIKITQFRILQSTNITRSNRNENIQTFALPKSQQRMQPIKNNQENNEKCASPSVSVLIDFKFTSNCAPDQIMLKLIKLYFESMFWGSAHESHGRGWIPWALGKSEKPRNKSTKSQSEENKINSTSEWQTKQYGGLWRNAIQIDGVSKYVIIESQMNINHHQCFACDFLYFLLHSRRLTSTKMLPFSAFSELVSMCSEPMNLKRKSEAKRNGHMLLWQNARRTEMKHETLNEIRKRNEAKYLWMCTAHCRLLHIHRKW